MTQWNEVYEKLMAAQLVRKVHAFMVPECSLLYLQEPLFGPFLSQLYPVMSYFKIHSDKTLKNYTFTKL
jgi:hypothetical protein